MKNLDLSVDKFQRNLVTSRPNFTKNFQTFSFRIIAKRCILQLAWTWPMFSKTNFSSFHKFSKKIQSSYAYYNLNSLWKEVEEVSIPRLLEDNNTISLHTIRWSGLGKSSLGCMYSCDRRTPWVVTNWHCHNDRWRHVVWYLMSEYYSSSQRMAWANRFMTGQDPIQRLCLITIHTTGVAYSLCVIITEYGATLYLCNAIYWLIYTSTCR